ncbi:MAG: FlgD immunoglobulin-like domain containing protein [Bacteroidota bacterium]
MQLYSDIPIYFIETDSSPERNVYASNGYVLVRRSHQAVTWDTIEVPVSPVSLSILKSDPNILCIGSSDGVYRSTDRGQTWDSLGLSQLHTAILVQFDERTSETIYAALQNSRTYGHGIYKTTDGGKSWFEKNNGLDTNNVGRFISNPKRPEELFVCTPGGIYRSTDAADHWSLMSPISPSTVSALCLDTIGTGRVFIGSYGIHGIYYLDLTTRVEDVHRLRPETSALGQNFPNPFNPSTSMEYSLRAPDYVRVVILDVLGREIRTIVNEEQKIGLHRIHWEGKNDVGQTVAGGVYFYRLETSDFVMTKKMLLIR